MAHLNFFGVENFKVFADLHRFDLKPITILTGTNSSGKSSLTKAILMMKEGFEKVSFKQGEFINTWSLNKLLLQNQLNLGNFNNCINRNSDSEELHFELPFRFPLIEEVFILKLTYKVTETPIKDGDLTFLSIKRQNFEENILLHSYQTGEMKLNLAYLKGKFDDAVTRVREVHKIENQITILEEPYITKAKSIRFDENDQLEVIEDVPKPKPMPDYVQSEIDELKLRQKSILKAYNINNKAGDTDSFSWSFGQYNIDIYEPHLRYDESRPLLNYSFVFNINEIEKHLKEFGLSESKFKELKKISQEVKDKLKSKTSDYKKYFIDIELSALQNVILNRANGYPVYEGLKDFTNTISDLRSGSEIKVSLAEYLIRNEQAIKDYFVLFDEYGFKALDEKNTPLLIRSVDGLLNDNLKYFTQSFLYDGIGQMFNTLSSIYKSMSYIPSVRTKVDRIFRSNSESYLNEVIYQLHQVKLSKKSKSFLNKYLTEFKIADSIKIELYEDSSFTKIYFLKNGEKQDLADVGYGVSQVLPILLKIALEITKLEPMPEYGRYFHESSIIIIEEPETNLHPALQSKLADMFIECYEKYDIQFIVETHSEYLVRKLQYLTAKKKFDKDNSVIYYFHKPDEIPIDEKQIKRIDILEDGSLSDDFGTGFFDEAANWELELLRLKNNKARQN